MTRDPRTCNSILLAKFLAVVAACIPVLVRPCVAAGKRPNFIVFITDDQSPMPWPSDGYRSSPPFGYCGSDEVLTPEIDRLAAEGMVFTRAYVSSSVCSPSRYTLLTGRYAGRCEGPEFLSLHPPGTMTRVENNTELEAGRANLARLLRDAGYRTGFVGKCHLVDHAILNNRSKWPDRGLLTYGKDDDPKNSVTSEMMRANHSRWCRRLAAFGFTWAGGVYAANLRELYNEPANLHNIDWTTEAALEFLSEPSDEPFFLYYATTMPHGPEPWNKKDAKYLRGLDGDPAITGEGYRADLASPALETRLQAKELVQSEGKAPDHAWLTWLDLSIGKLRQKLEATGEWDNTVVLVLSDHGSWRHGKTTLYEGGVRVPMLMHWPEGIAPGSEFDGLVQNTDITPTFLQLAGIDLPPEAPMDGASLAPVLAGSTDPVHEHLFLELGFARGVVTPQWKYIAVRYNDASVQKIAKGATFPGFNGERTERPYLVRNAHLGFHASRHNPHYFEPDQLYDLASDPREERNLIDAAPANAAHMAGVLRDYLLRFEGRPFGEFTSPGIAQPLSAESDAQ